MNLVGVIVSTVAVLFGIFQIATGNPAGALALLVGVGGLVYLDPVFRTLP